jgi:hypothetical protein
LFGPRPIILQMAKIAATLADELERIVTLPQR